MPLPYLWGGIRSAIPPPTRSTQVHPLQEVTTTLLTYSTTSIEAVMFGGWMVQTSFHIPAVVGRNTTRVRRPLVMTADFFTLPDGFIRLTSWRDPLIPAISRVALVPFPTERKPGSKRYDSTSHRPVSSSPTTPARGKWRRIVSSRVSH